MLQNIRIVIADDHPLYRDGVARTLAEAEGIEIVGQVGSATETEAAVAEFRPDLALLDISMPGGGVRAARRILAAHPEVCVVMLTASEDGDDVKAAFEAGASGYVLKGIGGKDLARVVRELAGGDSYVSPSLAARLLKSRLAQGSGGPVVSGIEGLTKREEDVLRLVARGLSNREIGGETGLQEKTVKHYMTGILQKLPARNRVEAALMAREAWGRRVHDRHPAPRFRDST
jgi:DNA-binding NarL/FixJ family response regulator